jgi:hypothetical protein
MISFKRLECELFFGLDSSNRLWLALVNDRQGNLGTYSSRNLSTSRAKTASGAAVLSMQFAFMETTTPPPTFRKL